MSWETLAAGQQLGAALGQPVEAAVVGKGIGALAKEAATKKLAKVWAVEHELLDSYTPDGYTAAVEELIRKTHPSVVLFPHTYQVRDFAPKLATRFSQVLVSDVIAARVDAGTLTLVRQFFQGKLSGDVRVSGAGPVFASLQAGAWRADTLESGSAAVEAFAPALSDDKIRQKPEAPFREAVRAVDLTAAEIIVSVGQGIKEQSRPAYCGGPRQGIRRGTGGVPSDLRRRLASHGEAGG